MILIFCINVHRVTKFDDHSYYNSEETEGGGIHPKLANRPGLKKKLANGPGLDFVVLQRFYFNDFYFSFKRRDRQP